MNTMTLLRYLILTALVAGCLGGDQAAIQPITLPPALSDTAVIDDEEDDGPPAISLVAPRDVQFRAPERDTDSPATSAVLLVRPAAAATLRALQNDYLRQVTALSEPVGSAAREAARLRLKTTMFASVL